MCEFISSGYLVENGSYQVINICIISFYINIMQGISVYVNN